MDGTQQTSAAKILAPLLAIATLVACGGTTASAPPASAQATTPAGPSAPAAPAVLAWQ